LSSHSTQEPSLLEAELLESFRTNVLGLINTIETFLPLVRLGSAKKIIAISTGMADINLIKDVGLDMGAPYAISKSGANIVMAKYHAMYEKEGILFMSVCPGAIKSEAVMRIRKCESSSHATSTYVCKSSKADTTMIKHTQQRT